jgi:hypothetical protein
VNDVSLYRDIRGVIDLHTLRGRVTRRTARSDLGVSNRDVVHAVDHDARSACRRDVYVLNDLPFLSDDLANNRFACDGQWRRYTTR